MVSVFTTKANLEDIFLREENKSWLAIILKLNEVFIFHNAMFCLRKNEVIDRFQWDGKRICTFFRKIISVFAQCTIPDIEKKRIVL